MMTLFSLEHRFRASIWPSQSNLLIKRKKISKLLDGPYVDTKQLNFEIMLATQLDSSKMNFDELVPGSTVRYTLQRLEVSDTCLYAILSWLCEKKTTMRQVL